MLRKRMQRRVSRREESTERSGTASEWEVSRFSQQGMVIKAEGTARAEELSSFSSRLFWPGREFGSLKGTLKKLLDVFKALPTMALSFENCCLPWAPLAQLQVIPPPHSATAPSLQLPRGSVCCSGCRIRS